MKKLSLKNLKLGANDMLQRNQLKTVFGGNGGYGDGCDSHCSSDSDCSGTDRCFSYYSDFCGKQIGRCMPRS